MRISRSSTQIYQKPKKAKAFWLSIFGVMLLLLLSILLCGCATNKLFVESERAYYEATVPMLRAYVTSDLMITESEKKIILETLDAWYDDLYAEVEVEND